jgi:hypothetical protein
MAWTAPRTWVAGEVVTAALLNTHLRDNLLSLGTWQTYTPAWTATTTNPALGNGTLTGRYSLTGNTVTWVIELLCGSTTTYGTGTYLFSTPTDMLAAGGGVARTVGEGVIYNVSSPFVPVICQRSSTNTLRMVSTLSGALVTETIGLASTEWLALSGTYEMP